MHARSLSGRIGIRPTAGRRAIAVALLAWLIGAHAREAGAAPRIEITSGRFGNVFTADERPVLTIAVTSDADGFRGRLRIAARDAYGAPAGRASVRVDLASGATMTREFSIRRRRLGHFTIETGLVDRKNQPRATGSTTAGIVPALDTLPADQSAVGYFVLPHDFELPQAYDIASEMRRFGIRWVRLTFTWWADDRRDRPDVSSPDWLDSSSFEQWVDAFRANGIEVLGVLFGTARWASSAIDDVEPFAGIPRWGIAPPRDLADWELFVRTLAERLRDRVWNWEVWNEPDIEPFWLGTAADFVPLVRAAAAALRSVDPGLRVVVNLVDRRPGGILFTDTVLAGAGDVLDVFGFHYGITDVREFRSRLRPGVNIWNTEAYGVPRRHISRWLAERAGGVERIFPFIYHSFLDDAVGGDFQRFGGYPVNLDYTPRPDAIALRTLADLVGSATFVSAAVAGLGYFTYQFVGPAGSVLALADGNEVGSTWSPSEEVRLLLQLPPGVRRVTVVDLMGNRQNVKVRKGVLRLRLRGVAAFLVSPAGTSLADARVLRAGLPPGR